MNNPPAEPDFYDELAPQYDEFVNWQTRLEYELPFILQQLDTVPHPDGAPAHVLDAAAGTAMHALALAQRGYTAAAADLSPAMTERARQNALAAGVALRLETVGFGALAPAFGIDPSDPQAARFDALLCLGNSLPHVSDVAGLGRALADFAACLRPGGLLLLQNRNYDAVLASRQRWMEPQAHRTPDSEKLFIRFYDFDPDGRITFNMLTLQRQGKGVWSQQAVATRLLPLTHYGLTNALVDAGFHQIQRYGNLSGEPFDAVSSPNLVLSAYL